MNTLGVPKTWKCFINGEFIRSESGRTLPINHNGLRTEYVPHSSRKDIRNAIEAATAAFKNWSEKTGYHRGQVLLRFAEMLFARQDELADLIPNVSPSEGKKEVKISAERIVRIAGWADKFQQILGFANPVSGPYHNFTLPTPIGASEISSSDGNLRLKSTGEISGSTVQFTGGDVGGWSFIYILLV